MTCTFSLGTSMILTSSVMDPTTTAVLLSLPFFFIIRIYNKLRKVRFYNSEFYWQFEYQFWSTKITSTYLGLGLGLWSWMPFWTLFQLYSGSQFYSMKRENHEKTTILVNMKVNGPHISLSGVAFTCGTNEPTNRKTICLHTIIWESYKFQIKMHFYSWKNLSDNR